MRALIPIPLVCALIACSAENERDVPVDVDRMNELALGPAVAIELQEISRADVEAAGMLGAGCSFMRDEGGPMLLIGNQNEAIFKHGDKFVRAASDVGSEDLPFGAHAHYDGLENAVRISIDRESEKVIAPELVYYDGAISISDERDRTIYTATGVLECGA